MLRVCPRDIYSHTVKDMDRQIVASSNDRKETRLTTVRLDPVVPTGPHPKHDTGNHPRACDPYVAKPGLGGMTAYPPKAMAVICIMKEAEMRTTGR